MALLLVWSGAGAALAQTTTQTTGAQSAQPVPDLYLKVGKFDVTYSDTELGPVRGAAWCRWAAPNAKCVVRVRNPKTGDLAELKADSSDIKHPYAGSRSVSIVLHGASPGSGAVSRPSPLQATGQGGDRGTGTITLKNGDTTQKTTAPVWSQAAVDDGTVTLDLEPDSVGRLGGEWRYRADAVTERDAKGAGRIGWFHTLPDSDRKLAPGGGGLKAVQEGSENWVPLDPRFHYVYTVEDQAAFDGVAALYPRLDANGNGTPAQKTRTLVLIGKDMPVIEREVFYDRIEGADGLSYKAIVDSRAKDLSTEEKIAFERARTAMEQGASAEQAAEYRKLQAVLVKVTITGDVDGGYKTFRWSGTQSGWTLQYGNNTADIRFKRLLSSQQSETVQQMAVPEQLVIEVETGARILSDSIALQLGGPGVVGDRMMLKARRVSGNIYRTPLLTFSPQGANPPGGATVVTVIPGKRIQATVDWQNTSFLRANLAAAVAGPPQTVWTDALHKAAACDKLSFDDANWPAFAARPSDTLWRLGAVGDSVPVKYGDHAAMIILREAFVNAMAANLTALQRTAVTPVDDKESDELIDSWYRSVHLAVWTVPDYPLAKEMVASPAGEVPFIKAFDTPFKEQTFQTLTTPDGYRRWIKWRREASLTVLKRTLDNMKKALADGRDTDPCDRKALLKLTGSGFRNVSARISPLLMKFAKPGQEGYGTRLLTEPDFLARGYVNNIDQLGESNDALSTFATARNAVVVSVVSLFVPAATWTFGWVSTTAEAVGTLTNTLGGLAMFGLQTYADAMQLYHDREDIAFALGAYSVIGVDRYVDTDTKRTDVWTTALNIFGGALLTGTSLTTVNENLATVRGGQVFNRILAAPQGGGAIVYEALSAGERADLALFMIRNEERIRSLETLSTVANAVDRFFSKLGAQAKGLPVPPDPPPAVAALERQAVADAVEAEPARPAGPSEAETRRVQAGEVRGGEDLQARQTLEAMAEDPTLAPTQKPGQLRTIALPWHAKLKSLPPANEVGELEVTIQGIEVKFRTLRGLSGGEFSHVYVVEKIPQEIRHLVKAGLGEKIVIKLLKDPLEPTTSTIPLEIRAATARRLKMVEELLGDSQRIPHAPFQVFEEEGIVLQSFVESKKDQVALLPTDPEAFRALPSDQRRAFMELIEKLNGQDMVCLDCHRGNLYIQKEGGKWVAKVLDTDFICTMDEVRKADSPFRQYFDYYVTNAGRPHAMSDFVQPVDPRTDYFASAQAFNLKFLEQKKWIEFNHANRVYTQNFLLPEDIKPYLPDWWPFRTEAPPPAPPPQKGGWIMERFDGSSPRSFANDDTARALLARPQAA